MTNEKRQVKKWTTPNQNIFVKGLVAYSNLSKLTKDEALDAWNNNPYHRFDRNPFTSLEINHAEILAPNGNKTASDEEMESRFFEKSKSDPNGGYHYEGVNQVYFAPSDTLEQRDQKIKEHRLPWIAVTDGKSGHCKQYFLNEGEELAQGDQVIMCFRTFQSKSGNIGLAMNGVVVVTNGSPLRTENRGSNISRTLNALGLILDPENEAKKLQKSQLPQGAKVDEEKQVANQSKPAPANNNPFPDDVVGVDDEDLSSNDWFSNDADVDE